MINRLYHLMKVKADIEAERRRNNQLVDVLDVQAIDGLINRLVPYYGFNPVGILAEDHEFVIVLSEYKDEHEGGPYAFAVMYKDKAEPLEIFSGYASPEQAFRASEDECAHIYESSTARIFGALAYEQSTRQTQTKQADRLEPDGEDQRHDGAGNPTPI